MAAVRLTRRFLPAMRNGGWGRVVMINTVAAKYPGAALVDYAATKAALAAATKALARKYAADGVLINSVMPGRIRTAMWERTALEIAESRGSTDQEASRPCSPSGRTTFPIGRFGTSSARSRTRCCSSCSDLATYFAGRHHRRRRRARLARLLSHPHKERDGGRRHSTGSERRRARRHRDHRGAGRAAGRAHADPEVALPLARVRRARAGAACGRACGRSRARSTTSPTPATTSSTASARSRC